MKNNLQKLIITGLLTLFLFHFSFAQSWQSSENDIYYSGGNVGIGTTSPNVKLSIDGGSDVGKVSGGFLMLGNLNTYNIRIDNNEIQAGNNGSFSNLYLNAEGGHTILNRDAGGNVGIGTTSPKEKLDVAGNIKMTGVSFKMDTGLRTLDVETGGIQDNYLHINGFGDHSGVKVNQNSKKVFDVNNGQFKVNLDGKVVIGNVPNIATSNDHIVQVGGAVICEGLRVALKSSDRWADDAFGKKPSLKKVEKHIKKNSHLIGVPSAKELVEKGIDVAEMDATLLRQIEWLYEHVIEQNKRISKLEKMLKAKK